MKIQEIAYSADGADMIGYLAVDDSKPGKRPGILVCHEGPGLNDHAKTSARRLAELGYIAFAMDYHGGGAVISDFGVLMQRIQGWMADPTGIRARAHAALGVLTSQPETDTDRLAGIGYCFGGTTVLELARAGEPLKGVVGFHSGLGTGRPAQKGAVKAKVLTQIGRDDPIIPPEQRIAFEQEMTAAGVDWQMIVYGGAGHSFTNKDVGAMGRPGFEYNAEADTRSWRAMLDFFDEVLGPV
jgi:dienelactone hydrolase